jgi:serine/threonine protein kinase
MPIEKRPDLEPIRGYRLIEKLGAGGFGEVWKCEAPGGIFKAIKFVYGNLNGLGADAAHAEEELRAVQHIKSIRHPFLLSIDRVEVVHGELVIITELADHNLFDRWETFRGQGHAGLPRAELLGYLREAAEVLDLLNQKFDLQHLDVKPHNLFVVSGHVKVADFGLVNSLSAGGPEARVNTGAVTPLYAAPELFQGKLSRHCDQYSLAIVYQELLTGTLPFGGRNTRQLLLAHTTGEPDLAPLPEADRALVARALAKNPDHRFPACLDFVRALQADATPKADSEPALLRPAATGSAETVLVGRGDTQKFRLPAAPSLPAGVLADHRFLERVSNSPLAEVWKAQAPDRRKRLVQLLYGFRAPEKALKDAVARLQSVTHPALLAPDVAHVDSGRIVLVTDAWKESLRDRFQQCQGRKLPGIRRGELVDYLRAAAEVLDYLYQQHGVQHLNLSPRSLILDHGWLQIAEFGYAQILWLPEEQDVACRSIRDAAPELADGRLGRHCDQYSLALIYAEMLCGVHPFQGKSVQGHLRVGAEPDLTRLPDLDREVVARALHPDPQERWASCSDMMLALEGTSAELYEQLQAAGDSFATFLVTARDRKRPGAAAGAAICPEEMKRAIADLIAGAGGAGDAPPPPAPDLTDGALTYQFQAGLPLGKALIQLEEYRRELGAEIVRQHEAGGTLRLHLPATFWQQWLGTNSTLEIDTELARVNPMSATPIDVTVRVETRNCSAKRARALLAKMGPDLLETMQRHLLINSEKRIQDRLLWPFPVTVIPVHATGAHDEPIVCRGKDISHTGVGFYLPHELSTADVLIRLPSAAHPPHLTVPATLVRAKQCADGWYDVGAIFRLPALRKSIAEINVAAS